MKKTAFQQAVIETEEIVKAITENTKSNFASHIKNTIGKTIAEGLEQDDKEDEVATGEVVVTDEPKADEPIIDTPADEPKADNTDVTVDVPGADALETPASDDVVSDEPVNTDVIVDEPVGDDTIDMTGASDEELVKVWKRLPDDAEIQVVKNDDGTLNITTPAGEEFLININEDIFNAIDEEMNSFESSLGGGEDKYSFLDNATQQDDEPMYEIVLDDLPSEIHVDANAPAQASSSNNTQDLPPAPAGNPLDNVVLEDNIDEVARTHADGRNMTRKPEGFLKYAASLTRHAVNENETANKNLILENTNLLAEKTQLINENITLKDENEEYKNTLRIVKEQLETVAVINTKMLYVNKLFVEHATTNAEKQSIVERFDSVTNGSQQDIKDLYKTIHTELNTKKTVTETVLESITTPVANTGETLLESTNPNNLPGLDRIKQIMKYDPSKR